MGLVLHKLNIIDDHIADDKEDFDLNFFPTSFDRRNTSAMSSESSVSLSRQSTRNSIVDSIWSRKASNAATIEAPTLSRAQTWRSERADSVVGGAPIEEEGTYIPFQSLPTRFPL